MVGKRERESEREGPLTAHCRERERERKRGEQLSQAVIRAPTAINIDIIQLMRDELVLPSE